MPRWFWRLTLVGVGAVFLVVMVGALLLRLGAADPPTAPDLRWQDHRLQWASGPSITVPSGEDRWFDPPTAAALENSFTLHLRARLSADSDPATAWGVWIETGDGMRVIYAISGERYTTTRLCPPEPPAEIEDCPALHPDWRWMEYNRLHGPGDINQITLHTESPGMIRLRLNNERMGIAPIQISGRWGVWVRGGREAPGTITWAWAAVYGR